MDSKAVIGVSIIFFTYALFSWALGHFLNRKKDPRPSELQSFLKGSLIIGGIVAAAILYGYFLG